MLNGIKFTLKKQFADLTKNVIIVWSKYAHEQNYKNLLISSLYSTCPIMKYLGEGNRPEELIYRFFLTLWSTWSGHNQRGGWALWRSKSSLGFALSTGFEEITEICWSKILLSTGLYHVQEYSNSAYRSIHRALKKSSTIQQILICPFQRQRKGSPTPSPVWMQGWPCFLLAVLKSLFCVTALSHPAEKEDGGRFPEEVSWSQLRDTDLP